MAKRKIRVNELLKREVSDFLHTRYRSEAVYITVTGVDVAPPLCPTAAGRPRRPAPGQVAGALR